MNTIAFAILMAGFILQRITLSMFKNSGLTTSKGHNSKIPPSIFLKIHPEVQDIIPNRIAIAVLMVIFF